MTKRIVILGSTGMLGSEVVRVAKQLGVPCLPISRTGAHPFDALAEDFGSLSVRAQFTQDDLVVNAIGWIPQKASGDLLRDKREAMLLNSSLLQGISRAQEDIGFRWLQIGTDCVFRGDKGTYVEADPSDASDLYGASKISGEAFCSNATLVRASIVGPDSRSHAGLYAWFKKASLDGKISGYLNHRWNGVTTTAFARLAVGLMTESLGPVHQHWTPADIVTKHELLEMFSAELGFQSGLVRGIRTDENVDRTLSTSRPDLNERLWSIAGYDGVPTVRELVAEMIDEERGLA